MPNGSGHRHRSGRHIDPLVGGTSAVGTQAGRQTEQANKQASKQTSKKASKPPGRQAIT